MNYHAALAHFPKITYSRYKKLAAYFSDFKNIWDAEIIDLVPAGLEEHIAQEFLNWRDNNPIEKILERLEEERISTVSIDQPEYPRLLKEIFDPPHTLFVRGTLPAHTTHAIGVVGTRKMTPYGKFTCEEIVAPLAQQHIMIVSGLALGIDAVAHKTTLAHSGITIAVLGSGINKKNIYPTTHTRLAEQIIDAGGAVVSEYPPRFSPTPYSFPARNRIIAGLSTGTLVIEAPETSGALITARCALDYNRDVFCIPHPINSPTGIGPNNLIKMGARLISTPQDILETLNIHTPSTTDKPIKISLNQTEQHIFSCLSQQPVHIDTIIKQTLLDSATVNSALVLMEIRGIIRNIGNMNYVAR